MTSTPALGSLQRSGWLAGFAGRVKNLLVRPFPEWQAVASESTTRRGIYLGYVAPLAGAVAVASFLASTLVGIVVGQETLRTGFAPGLAGALVGFALCVVTVLVLARLAARLASRPGEDLRLPALRVIAYSFTPVWLAAIAASIPMLAEPAAWVGGLYGIFLLFLGLRTVLRSSNMDAINNTAIVTVCAAAFAIVTPFVTGFTSGALGLGKPTFVGAGYADTARYIGAAGGVVGRILAESDSQGRGRMGDAIGGLAMRPIDMLRGREHEVGLMDQIQQAAATLGAGGRRIEPVQPEALAVLLPPALTGMRRTEASSGPENAGKLRGSLARARYENSDSAITLTIADTGEAAGIVRVIAWFDPYLDKTTAWGYERKRRIDGHYAQEKYNRLDRLGKMMLFIDDRFVVQVEGVNVDDTALREALQAVDARMLTSLAPH